MDNLFSKKTGVMLFSLVVLVSVGASVYLNSQESAFVSPHTDSAYTDEYLHGEILEVSALDDGGQNLKVKMMSGDEKNLARDVRVDSFNNYNDYKKGDIIYIYKSTTVETGESTYAAVDYYHKSGIYWLFLIFVVLTILVAGGKGVRAIISVVASLGFFYFFFVKLIGTGFSPLFASVFFVGLITLITIPLIHGFNKKSLASIIAIFVGYAASLLIVFWFKSLVNLGTAPGEEFRTLGIMFADIDLAEILIASLFLGAIGALIDTAISISSAIFETLQEAPQTSFKKIYTIGMNVGKDILGSMTNTLLFAYISSSLPFLILLSLSQMGGPMPGMEADAGNAGDGGIFYELLNMDFIALELTRTFVGAVSLVLLIPLVSATSAYFLTIKSKK
jgi:uncharacterized membrane protein